MRRVHFRRRGEQIRLSHSKKQQQHGKDQGKDEDGSDLLTPNLGEGEERRGSQLISEDTNGEFRRRLPLERGSRAVHKWRPYGRGGRGILKSWWKKESLREFSRDKGYGVKNAKKKVAYIIYE